MNPFSNITIGRRRVRTISSFFLISCSLCAQIGFHPTVSNVREIGPFSNSNFAIAQNLNGSIYFGNENGLLTYDGFNLNDFIINDSNAVNSLIFAEGNLFAGLTDDFGILNTDETGNIYFSSLSAGLNLPSEGIQFNNIGVSGNYIIFESDKRIFSYNLDSREVKEFSYLISGSHAGSEQIQNFSCHNINDELYAQTSDGNFYKYSKDAWTLYWPDFKLNGKIVAIVTPGNYRRSTARIPDDSYIVMENGEVMKVMDGNPVKMATEFDQSFLNYRVTDACTDNNNSLYIATEGGGILQIDKDGNLKNLFTINEGLIDNYILGLMFDRDGNVWSLHNNGVSVIHSGFPLQISYPIGSQVLSPDEEVLNKLQNENSKTGLTTFREGGQYVHEVSGNIWRVNPGGGVIKSKISSDLSEISENKFYPSLDGSKTPKKCYVFEISGKTLFSQGNIIYAYDDDSDTFRSMDNMSVDLLADKEIRNATNLDLSHFLIETADALCLVAFDSIYSLEGIIPLKLLNYSKTDGNLHVSEKGNSLLLPINAGTVMIDKQKLKKFSIPSKLSFNFIGGYNKKGEFQRYPISGKKKVKTDLRNILVSLSYPEYNFMPLDFRFHLKGGGTELDTISSKPVMNFNELTGGSYTLLCQVINPDGSVIDEIAFSFQEIAPWPLRWWAWLIYIAFLAVIVYFISNIRVKVLLHTRERQFSENKSKQDAMIREQALIIANQGKKIHEKRLSAKSREMMEIIPSVNARQIVIDNLRNTIALRRENEIDSAMPEKVLKEFTGTMGDSRIFWDLLHKYFDLVNEAYFKSMSSQYPELTPTDLKFCILVKMEMTTKEISKFTDLSVRGVETARYRLRKKLKPSSNQSLTELLNQ